MSRVHQSIDAAVAQVQRLEYALEQARRDYEDQVAPPDIQWLYQGHADLLASRLALLTKALEEQA